MKNQIPLFSAVVFVAAILGLGVFLYIHFTGGKPYLKIHPTSPDGNALIAYDPKQHNSSKYWISNIESFLKEYTDPSLIPGRSEKKVDCNYDQPPQKDQVCDINIQYWSPCTAKNNYSYHRASPCIFLTFTQIEGWEPEFYTDVENLPVDMPTDLKEHIEYVQRSKPLHMQTVWLSCEGETEDDAENIGPMFYIPTRGFPGYSFNSETPKGYLNPLAAVNFEKPKFGRLIKVICKAWAKNIDHSQKAGLTSFELFLY